MDVIGHEYAHHMDHVLYDHDGHGPTWKMCCHVVGATPIRCYNEERADYYRNKHLEADKISEKYDTYKVGAEIEHPHFGVGVIEEIFGENIYRSILVRFQNTNPRKLGLEWVDAYCKRI